MDRKTQIKIVEQSEFLRLEDSQPWPDRAEAAVALALEELHLRKLHVARANVICDRDGEDIVLERIGSDRDGSRDGTAEDQRKLDLVIQQRHMRRPPYYPVCRIQRGVGFGEEHVEDL